MTHIALVHRHILSERKPRRAPAAGVIGAGLIACSADAKGALILQVHEEFIRGTLDELACKLVEQPLKVGLAAHRWSPT